MRQEMGSMIGDLSQEQHKLEAPHLFSVKDGENG
jgi:hypothetical protein